MLPSRTRTDIANIHASCVAAGNGGVLILGNSGQGKSDLALRLIDRGFALVSDDQTIVKKVAGRLMATAPLTIRGKLEIRGVGIVDMVPVDDQPVALVVELTSAIQRFPDHRERQFLGIGVPLVGVDAMTASAASKVALALDHLGLKR